MRKPPGAARGNRHKSSIAITRCRLACSWEAWLWSHFSLATGFCTGTEGSGEDPDQPGVAASHGRVVLRHVRLPSGIALYAHAAQEHYRRRRFFSRRRAVHGVDAAARIRYRDPAAQAAEA